MSEFLILLELVCMGMKGGGEGRRSIFLVLTVPFAPANRLAGCPGGAALMPWCSGLAAHFKNEKSQLAYSSSTNRLVHQI